MDQGTGDRATTSTTTETRRPKTGGSATPADTPTIGKRQLLAACALIALVLHTLAVLWTWYAWSDSLAGAGWWLTWTDFPVSLLYGGATHGAFLVWSLLLGGLQWAVTGALVALGVWHFATFRQRRS